MIPDALRGQKRTPVCLLSFYLGSFAGVKKGLNPEGALGYYHVRVQIFRSDDRKKTPGGRLTLFRYEEISQIIRIQIRYKCDF